MIYFKIDPKKVFSLIFFFCFISLSLNLLLVANDDQKERATRPEHLEEFCFQEKMTEEELTQKLSFLLLKDEHILPSQSALCFHILTSKERVILFQTYLAQNFSLARSQTSSQIKHPQCLIHVYQKAQDDHQQKDLSLSFGKNKAHAKAYQSLSHRKNSTQLTLLSGKSGKMTIQDHQLQITCTRHHSSGLFSIDIQVLSIPPHSSSSSPNTILQTSLQISKGKELSLGSWQQEKQQEGHDLSSRKGAQWQQNTYGQQQEWFLMIDGE